MKKYYTLEIDDDREIFNITENEYYEDLLCQIEHLTRIVKELKTDIQKYQNMNFNLYNDDIQF